MTMMTTRLICIALIPMYADENYGCYGILGFTANIGGALGKMQVRWSTICILANLLHVTILWQTPPLHPTKE